MRIRQVVGCLFWLVACGNQEAPPATTPTATASAAPSAAPVESASAAPAASASAAPEPSATPAATASAAPAPPAFTETLKELVASAKSIKLTWREDLSSNEAKTVTIKTPATIKAILDAMGPDQKPAGGTPAYMSTYMFRFEDGKGNPIATVSLYSSANLSDAAKKYGRIDMASNGKFGGVTIANYAELQKKLKAIGVPLP
jgi:cytoskeletal protein RodZ